MSLLRSVSEYKVKEQLNNSNSSNNSNNINLYPKDFIILNGKQYRIKRTSEQIKLSEEDTIENIKIEMLLNSIEEANKTIEIQSLQLIEKDEQIKKLEQKIILLENENENRKPSSPSISSISSPPLSSSVIINNNKIKKKNRLQEALMSTRESEEFKVIEGLNFLKENFNLFLYLFLLFLIFSRN